MNKKQGYTSFKSICRSQAQSLRPYHKLCGVVSLKKWFIAVIGSRRRFITRDQGIIQSLQRVTNTEVTASQTQAATNSTTLSGLILKALVF